MEKRRTSQTQIPVTGVAPAANQNNKYGAIPQLRVLTPLAITGDPSPLESVPGVTSSRAADSEKEPMQTRTSGVLRVVPEALIQTSTSALLAVDGCVGAAVLDIVADEVLGSATASDAQNFEAAAAAYIEVLRAQRYAETALGTSGELEDTLVTSLTRTYVMRPSNHYPTLIFFVMLDRSRSNLVLARMALARAADTLR
jgi:hypothetical protein